jgi:hypothetical protein
MQGSHWPRSARAADLQGRGALSQCVEMLSCVECLTFCCSASNKPARAARIPQRAASSNGSLDISGEHRHERRSQGRGLAPYPTAAGHLADPRSVALARRWLSRFSTP